MSNIHKTAIIEDGASIADNVTIGPFSHIGSEVTIGSGTEIMSHAVISGNTTIGENNRIFSHVSLGSEPQDLKFDGEKTELIIGDNNTIREFTQFNTGTKGGGGITKVGSGNLFMAYVHLGHDVIIGDNCVLANAATLGGHAVIGNNVVIGGLSAIHQFVHIGDFTMVGGASALVQDAPPYCLVEGNRATLRGLNLNGLRRHLERDEINALRKAYKELFTQGNALQDVVNNILESNPTKKVEYMCQFIQSSSRGIPFTRSKN